MPDWDKVYAEKNIEDVTPADVLKKNLHLLAGSGEALDYACGLGGNAIMLESNGYQVSAWDCSNIGISKLNGYAEHHQLNISANCIDLEVEPPDSKNKFDVKVVSYFLHRETIRGLYDYLKTDGLLFYQTFSGQKMDGHGPSREEFRLRRGELLAIFSDMELLYYREDKADVRKGIPDSRPGQVYFVAKK